MKLFKTPVISWLQSLKAACAGLTVLLAYKIYKSRKVSLTFLLTSLGHLYLKVGRRNPDLYFSGNWKQAKMMERESK